MINDQSVFFSPFSLFSSHLFVGPVTENHSLETVYMRKGAHSIQWLACSCLCPRPECRSITLNGTDGTNTMRYICLLFSDEVPELLSFLFLQRVYLPSTIYHSGGSVTM